MIERELAALVRAAVERAAPELGVEAIPDIEITRPRAKEHGDYATNVALALASTTRRNPREVAEALVRHLPESDAVAKVEVAGPGFVNIFVAHGWLYRVLEEVERLGAAFGRTDDGAGKRVQVEFVSANPTGPLHVGTARNAALGDWLARAYEALGFEVDREYYWNDTGTQMDLFGASVEARYLQRFGREAQIPEGGYQGGYVAKLAERIAGDVGDRLVDADPTERRETFVREARRLVVGAILATLDRFRARVDTFKSEGDLVDSGAVAAAVERLRREGYAYDHEGAVWFRATEFGDDKDRVLIRRTGEPTYFAKDCAYVLDKAGRGYASMVYVWGADHHGDVKRLKGAAQAFGIDPERVEIVLYQLVSLYRGGRPVPMSKRTGDVITLDELLDEVGTDAARYTLLSRSPETRIDFDIELVKRQTLDNPVYYVQYAHARIASVLRYAEERGVRLAPFSDVTPEELVHETELALLRKLAEMPEHVRVSVSLRAPNRITRYAEELAAGFHRFYTECRVVTDDEALTQARLHVAAATRRVLANVLELLGVSAPNSMERLEEQG